MCLDFEKAFDSLDWNFMVSSPRQFYLMDQNFIYCYCVP